MEAAFLREKRLKKWRRAWKLELIERHKPAMARPLRRTM
jgi:putative endonuclease